MLAYNSYYLYNSQRALPVAPGLPADVSPPHHPREVLQSLSACCHSVGLGCWSHVTGRDLLQRPGSPSQLLNVNLNHLINEAWQTKAEDVVEEDWSLI